MNKEDVVCIHKEIVLSHIGEWNPAICNNMDGPWKYYAKRHKSDGKIEIPYDFTDMRNLKNNNEKKKTNKIKQKQKHRWRGKISGIEGNRGGNRIGEWAKRVKKVNIMVMDGN